MPTMAQSKWLITELLTYSPFGLIRQIIPIHDKCPRLSTQHAESDGVTEVVVTLLGAIKLRYLLRAIALAVDSGGRLQGVSIAWRVAASSHNQLMRLTCTWGFNDIGNDVSRRINQMD
jgi:hypothetical protein